MTPLFCAILCVCCGVIGWVLCFYQMSSMRNLASELMEKNTQLNEETERLLNEIDEMISQNLK